MKRYISLLLGILAFIPILAQQSDYYYYYRGNRIDLEVDSTRLYVVSEGTLQTKATALLSTRMADYNISTSTKSYVYNHVESLQQRRSAVPEVYFSTLEMPKMLSTTQYEVLVERVKSEDNVWQVLPSFKLNGKWVDVTNNFFVKLNSANDVGKLQEMANQYGVEIIGYNKSMPLWYTLSCTSFSEVNALEAANIFYATGLFANSSPEFCYHDLARSNDEYFNRQWNLKNTFWQYPGTVIYAKDIDVNVESAWEITKGENVVVAVFDNGVATYHPDLDENIHDYSFNAITNTSPATLLITGNSVGHGTACAGIIAAEQDNDEGISGIAPKAKIMSISADLDNLNSQQIVNGFAAACCEADIINCSWGGISDEYVDAAIQDVLDNGRGGRGAIVVFAAGNEGDEIDVTIANNPRVLSVGAVGPNGIRAYSGSCGSLVQHWDSYYGVNLDIVAPGASIYTTDIPGSLGYNSGDYKENFGMTSAAAPHVAGVAALVLSVHPELRGDDVVQIIERSARKITTDTYTYATDTVHWSGTWHEEVGYGLVDATAAVTAIPQEVLVTHYRNKVLNTSDACFYYNVEAENVRVQSDADFLELGAVNRVLIKSSFVVEKGAELIIDKVVYNEEEDSFEM